MDVGEDASLSAIFPPALTKLVTGVISYVKTGAGYGDEGCWVAICRGIELLPSSCFRLYGYI